MGDGWEPRPMAARSLGGPGRAAAARRQWAGGEDGTHRHKVWRRLQLNAEVTHTDTSFQRTHSYLLLVSSPFKVYIY